MILGIQIDQFNRNYDFVIYEREDGPIIEKLGSVSIMDMAVSDNPQKLIKDKVEGYQKLMRIREFEKRLIER